jgi:type IV pilus assembly protein PilA
VPSAGAKTSAQRLKPPAASAEQIFDISHRPETRAAVGYQPRKEQQMLARLRKSMEEKDQGFTLIELLVVIIIIGILAAIAIPVFLNQRKKGWDAQAKADLKNMATAEETYLTDNGSYVALTDASTGALADAGFKKSADTSNWVSMVSAADPSSGYCLTVKSKSGTYWFYSSANAIPAPTGATPTNTCA